MLNCGQDHNSILYPPQCAPALLPDELHAPHADPLPSLDPMSSGCGGQLTWRMRHNTLWRCCLTRCMHSSRTFSPHRVLYCPYSAVRFARPMRLPPPDAYPQTCDQERLLAISRADNESYSFLAVPCRRYCSCLQTDPCEVSSLLKKLLSQCFYAEKEDVCHCQGTAGMHLESL